jgi:hypothetical protein
MRLTAPATWLFALSLLAAPAPASADRAREVAGETERRPATDAERDRYAERERQAEALEEFEGGRRRGGGAVEATTIIIVLLVVILVLIVI